MQSELILEKKIYSKHNGSIESKTIKAAASQIQGCRLSRQPYQKNG